MPRRDVIVIGGGVAGLTAGLFAARAGLDTLCVDGGSSILARNAHLENYPGFPAGVNARVLLEQVREQAGRNGCAFLDGRADGVAETDAGFAVTLAPGDDRDEGGESGRVDLRGGRGDDRGDPAGVRDARSVICASWPDASYLEGLDVGLIDRGSKTFVDVDERGRTAVEGLYAAGRIAGTHHQTVVAAGDGASVALALIEDADVPFYHDWVAPEGYFTGRGRDVPPGCEEIDGRERRRRERASMARTREAFAEPHPDEPTQHPDVDVAGESPREGRSGTDPDR